MTNAKHMQLEGKNLGWQRGDDKLKDNWHFWMYFCGNLLFFLLLLLKNFILITLIYRLSFRIRDNNLKKVLNKKISILINLTSFEVYDDCCQREDAKVIYVFRQQLQELRLKQEQERDQRGGRRRDLQGETAGERVKPRPRAQTQTPNSNCDCDPQPVSLSYGVSKDAAATWSHKRAVNSLCPVMNGSYSGWPLWVNLLWPNLN